MKIFDFIVIVFIAIFLINIAHTLVSFSNNNYSFQDIINSCSESGYIQNRDVRIYCELENPYN